jgi:hypothetical protein
MKNKIAFLTTIYPVDVTFVDVFFDSLINQSNKAFDVIVVNDGFIAFEKVKEKFSCLNIIEVSGANSIAKNRELLVKYAIDNNYAYGVFGDIDDYFQSNRIETSVALLADHDIVVNDLTPFCGQERLAENTLSSRLDNLTSISWDYVKDKNIFGMSNTAIKLEGLVSADIECPPELVAIDWFLFSNLLLQGKKAIFTNDTVTYYRQYSGNTVGIGVIAKETILKAIEVKLIHYRYMAKINSAYWGFLTSTQALSDWNQCADRLHEYTQRNIKELTNPLWWELVELGDRYEINK